MRAANTAISQKIVSYILITSKYHQLSLSYEGMQHETLKFKKKKKGKVKIKFFNYISLIKFILGQHEERHQCVRKIIYFSAKHLKIIYIKLALKFITSELVGQSFIFIQQYLNTLDLHIFKIIFLNGFTSTKSQPPYKPGNFLIFMD